MTNTEERSIISDLAHKTGEHLIGLEAITLAILHLGERIDALANNINESLKETNKEISRIRVRI